MNIIFVRKSLCALLVSLIIAGIVRAGSKEDPLDKVEKEAAEWVKIRAETVRLETEWNSQREITDATARALEQRAQSSEEKRNNLKAKGAKEREELDAVAAKNELSSQALDSAQSALKQTQESVLQMRALLPPRLSAALELPYKSLANPELSPGDRMQFTMTILNRCLQFNRTITYGEEPLQIESSAEPKILEVIYWGLNRAYALDRQAKKAWLGHSDQQGWRWDEHAEAVPAVERLIAVYNDKAEPAFIEVPAIVSHTNSVAQ